MHLLWLQLPVAYGCNKWQACNELWPITCDNCPVIVDCLQAKQALQRASELEPDDAHLLESLQKADTMERREAEQHKHKFKRKDILHPSKNRSPSTKKQRTKPKLSFDDDDT